MYKHILYEKNEQIDTVTLNRPDTANAFTEELLLEVINVFEEIEQESDARVVVLKGTGKLFSGGGDIHMFKEILNTGDHLSIDLALLPGKMVESIRKCSKPVIASIQGAAAGAGFGVALACDYRVMSENAKLVPAFNDIALSGDSGLYYFLGKFMSPNKAFDIMTLEKAIKADDAKEMGLVTRVAKESELADETQKLVNELLNKPTKVIEKQKKLLNNYFYKELETFTREEAINLHLSSQDKDFTEGVSAFLEKRQADFNGY